MSSLPYIFPEPVPNLDVISLSESEVSERWKSKYGEEVYSIIQEFIDIDRSILDHVATSPGVAEEFMISEIINYEKSGLYGNVVWDTPASSSTMHLLKVQSEFYEHLGRDIRFILRLKSGMSRDRATSIIKRWQDLSVSVWNALKRSRFMLVTTPDELSIFQSIEIEDDLKTLGIRVNGHICNRVRADLRSSYRCDRLLGEFSGSEKDIISKMRPLLRNL